MSHHPGLPHEQSSTFMAFFFKVVKDQVYLHRLPQKDGKPFQLGMAGFCVSVLCPEWGSGRLGQK